MNQILSDTINMEAYAEHIQSICGNDRMRACCRKILRQCEVLREEMAKEERR